MVAAARKAEEVTKGREPKRPPYRAEFSPIKEVTNPQDLQLAKVATDNSPPYDLFSTR